MTDPWPSGARLAYLRLLSGLTQLELAESANVHVSTVNELETGRRRGNVKTWKKLADSLNVSIEDFINEGVAS